MYWVLDTGRITTGPFMNPNIYNGNIYFAIDVNGKNKINNCAVTNAYAKVCTTDQIPDTVLIIVFKDGKVYIHPDDTWSIEAVKTTIGISGK